MDKPSFAKSVRETRAKGRPLRKVVDSIFTRMWVEEVRFRAHCRSYRELERLLEPDKFRIVNGETIRPCKWDKYARGNNVPSLQQIAKMEHLYPGTAYLMRHPLREILGRPIPSLSELHTYMSGFGSRLKSLLFEAVRDKSSFSIEYRRRKLTKYHYIEIRKQGDLEALTCLFALAREAEWSRNEWQHKSACHWAMRLLFALWINPPLLYVYRPLWEYLLQEFFSYRYRRAAHLNAETIDIDMMSRSFNEILLRMEDAGVLNGMIFQQQARLFWHADLGNLERFLKDARYLNGFDEYDGGIGRSALAEYYRQLLSKPLLRAAISLQDNFP